MIEKIVRDYLAGQLPELVGLSIPSNPTGSFVVIQKTGSGSGRGVHPATVAIQSYGETLYTAAELNERVKAAMEGIDHLNEVTSVELNTDYNFTDTASKRYRYQAVFDLYHY